jgi:dTDP-4-amino-4,6-dideoxygalactose transaminase
MRPEGASTYHQYTVRVLNGKRDELRSCRQENGIGSEVYYRCRCINSRFTSKS